MDNFMDKLAQKFNAQEMIKGNLAAETAEHKKLQAQLASYESCLQDMRKLNLQNVEMSDKLNALMDEVSRKAEAITLPQQENDKSLKELEEAVAALKDQVTDFVHKENVKVYRNVQAAVIEELQKQTEILTEENRAVRAKVEGMKKLNIAVLVFGILSAGSSIAVLVFFLLNMMAL